MIDTEVKKINPQVRRILNQSGYPRIEDMAFIKPNNYYNLGELIKVQDAVVGQPMFVELTCVQQIETGKWPNKKLQVLANDDSGDVILRFHNYNAGIKKMLAPEQKIRAFGVAERSNFPLFSQHADLKLTHPKLLSPNKPPVKHLIPRYPAFGQLKPYLLQTAIKNATELVLKNYQDIPESCRKLSNTFNLSETLRLLHTPTEAEEQKYAEKLLHTLKFDEWLAHQILQKQRRLKLNRRQSTAIPSKPTDIKQFEKNFDFQFTNDQIQAMQEVAEDIAKPVAMRRLVHGDVGCGKTLVAAFACWLTAKQNYRSAILCPTIILAAQHYSRLKPVFNKLGINCVFLAGSTSSKERTKVLASIASNPSTVVIGTHALFQAKTNIPELKFAVIDEQHRFGVAQRKALESKGGGAHVLMLSATPIPRSLELGLFSHIAVTRILERPHKKDIRTMLFVAARAHDVLNKIIRHGYQAFWICPLIKKSAKDDHVRAAEDVFKKIKKLAPQLKPRLIHGKLSNDKKIEAMRAFENGETKLLVATTVVEVGIDAPEADVIVIDHCERLGLSQLHQLRGRVGRGKKTGFCALLYEPEMSIEAENRLKAMHNSDDGFEIARSDLKIRGPGDMVGKRQSGGRRYRFAEYDDDFLLIEQAKLMANELVEHDPKSAEEHFRLWLGVSKFVAKTKTQKRTTKN